MARKTVAKNNKVTEKSSPKFPYTITPNALKRILELIPTKPKPPKLTGPVIKTWGVADNNAYTALGVLKEIGLIDAAGTPTDAYVAYMSATSGGALAQKVRERYSLLFEQHENPQNASSEDLKRFFNINSGGAERTIGHQVRTFKILSEFCRFDAPIASVPGQTNGSSKGSSLSSANNASVHFDLHIHLPEAKSVAEYEAIIRAVSDYIVKKVCP